jgi:DNA-binding CsgD family transcriptional regulator
VRELCRRGLDADTFRRLLRARLFAVVPFDAYCVNTADPHTLDVTSSIGDGLDAAEASQLFAIEHARTDVNVLADLARARINVATVGAHPERSERMRAIFLPRGYVDELRAALVEHGRCWGYLHLFRTTRFTPAEKRVIASLVKDVAVALRSATARTPSMAAGPAEPGVLTFGRDGMLRKTTSTAHTLLDAIPVDERHGGPPHAIVSLAAAANVRGATVESAVASRRGLLRLVALAEVEGAVVILDAARRAQIVDAILMQHRLSSREQEVCRAILRRLSDKEIATTLDVGIETVKAHARAAFAKLSVSGRGGLLAKLGV